MQKIQHRARVRRAHRPFMYSWPALLVLGVFVVFAGRATWNAFQGVRAAESHLRDTRERREAMERRRDDLTARVKELSNSYGLEKELRERYSLRKPGEEVVIFIRRQPEAPDATEASLVSWWERLRTFIPTL